MTILGNGTQSKSYIHVTDVVEAVLIAHRNGTERFNAYNVATADYITVTQIAELAIDCLGLPRDQVDLVYGQGDRGWKGDIPVVRLNSGRIRSLGWSCRLSALEAMRRALLELRDGIIAGHL